MNFYSVIIYGYIIIASYLAYIFIRDIRQGKKYFLGRHKILAYSASAILIIGILAAFDAHFIEPKILRIVPVEIKITNKNLTTPIKIAFIADIQVGNDKKSAWVEKIVKKIEQENPDIILLGGDQIDNEGNFEDESKYLEPLSKLVQKYPIYAVMGNHEYGIGNDNRDNINERTGDHSQWAIERLKKLGIKLLKNQTDCPEIKNQKICIFGLDDVWGGTPNFDTVPTSTIPLIFLTHNPDGILYWPTNLRAPDLVLAGHTHGGQVYLPFIGPLANAGIELPKKYYRGLNYYPINLDPSFHGNDKKTTAPIYTTVGSGESGGAIRFWTPPEIVIINLKPQE